MIKVIILATLFAFHALAALGPADQKKLDKAFAEYEKLHASFFEYDGAKAEQNAKTLSKTLSEIKDPELSKKLKFSQTKLDEITKDASRDANNQNMHLVSMALIHIMKNEKVGGEYKAYQCPMVKKKWIQNAEKGETVQNPYAPEMPNCGGTAD